VYFILNLWLASTVCLTILRACHGTSSALMQHDATILHVIRESSVRCTGQTALKRQDLSRTPLAHHELESKFIVFIITVIIIREHEHWPELLIHAQLSSGGAGSCWPCLGPF
jgi:hypothetical protein